MKFPTFISLCEALNKNAVLLCEASRPGNFICMLFNLNRFLCEALNRVLQSYCFCEALSVRLIRFEFYPYAKLWIEIEQVEFEWILMRSFESRSSVSPLLRSVVGKIEKGWYLSLCEALDGNQTSWNQSISAKRYWYDSIGLKSVLMRSSGWNLNWYKAPLFGL